MDYPVSGYRSSTARARTGYQRPSPAPVFEWTPANDNVAPVQPANDNEVPRAPEPLPKALRAIGSLLARYGGKAAARANPWVNAVVTAIELYEAFGGRWPWDKDQADIGYTNFEVPPGWYVILDCGGGPGELIWNAFTACGSPYSHPAGAKPPATYVQHSTFRTANFYKLYAKSPTTWWYHPVIRYKDDQNPYADSRPNWRHRPRAWAEPAPAAVVAIDPMSQPVSKPMPEPVVPPHRVLPKRGTNPWRSPREQRVTGPRPKPASVVPERSIVVRPHAKPRVRPGASRREPPGPGVKERKMTGRLPRIVMGGLNVITEATDYIAAFWKALPEERRPRWIKRPDQRLVILYKYWDEVDLEQAAINLLLNEIEDRFFGKIGQVSKKAAQRIGLSYGLQLGQKTFRSPGFGDFG